MIEHKQEQMTGLCVHGNFDFECLKCQKTNQEQRNLIDLNVLSKFREQALNKICPELKQNPDLEINYQGTKQGLQEIMTNNSYLYPEYKWTTGDLFFENLDPIKIKEKTKYYYLEEIDPYVSVEELIEHLQYTIKEEVLDNISQIEFINHVGPRARAECQIEKVSGKGQLRVYNLSEEEIVYIDETSKEERKYELLVGLYHELGHIIWSTILHPTGENKRDLRGLGSREIRQNDREVWFGILMDDKDKTIYRYVEEQFYEQKPGIYEEKDRIEEGWAGVFSQVAINPTLLDKFPQLKILMGKFFKQ